LAIAKADQTRAPASLHERREVANEAADGRAAEPFEHLDALVRSLVARYRRLQVEHTEVRRRLEEREARIRELDEALFLANQTRRDAAKRVDDLITQLDALDSRLGGGEPGAESASDPV
jgi:chromosome segregation ATPase